MWRKALEQFADAYCIQSRLAIRLMEAGRREEAFEHYRRAYELMPSSFGRVESHCFGCESVFQGAAQQTLAALAGAAPRFFRAPAGLRNPFLDFALTRLGLQLVSWTRRGYDTRNADAADVLARLTRALAPGDILLLHDGHAVRGANGAPVLLDVLPRLLDALQAAALRPVTLRAALD